jgi:hypothetical protein
LSTRITLQVVHLQKWTMDSIEKSYLAECQTP